MCWRDCRLSMKYCEVLRVVLPPSLRRPQTPPFIFTFITCIFLERPRGMFMLVGASHRLISPQSPRLRVALEAMKHCYLSWIFLFTFFFSLSRLLASPFHFCFVLVNDPQRPQPTLGIDTSCWRRSAQTFYNLSVCVFFFFFCVAFFFTFASFMFVFLCMVFLEGRCFYRVSCTKFDKSEMLRQLQGELKKKKSA